MTRCVGSTTRSQHARIIQKEVTRLLLASRENLLNDIADLARLLPSWEQRDLEIAERKRKEATKVSFACLKEFSIYLKLSISI